MPNLLRRSSPYLLLLAGLSWQTAQAQVTATGAQETFDTGSKPNYAAGSVALPSGTWTFTDAVLGSDPADHKNGAQAARLEGNGRLTLESYLLGGASTVTVQHAVYGTDASSSWELWAQSQACNCNKWTKVGTTVFSTSATLQAASFTVNIPGSVKFEIRKTSGGAARLDIDDFTVVNYGVAQPSQDNDNLALGNPSGAVADVNYPNNYLLTKPQYVVGYNAAQGKPNWVSWHLDISDRGTSDRQLPQRPFAARGLLPGAEH
jgi:endonuclease G